MKQRGLLVRYQREDYLSGTNMWYNMRYLTVNNQCLLTTYMSIMSHILLSCQSVCLAVCLSVCLLNISDIENKILITPSYTSCSYCSSSNISCIVLVQKNFHNTFKYVKIYNLGLLNINAQYQYPIVSSELRM